MRFLTLVILFNASLFAQEGVWYKDIDHALANPDSVFQLQLKKKGLSAFPSELCQFPNLQKLDLSKNKIGAFPDSLNYLINLTFLDLSNSQTQLGSIIFFYSRLLHYFCYLFAVPWLRTGFFLLSWIGLIMLSIQIITYIY